MCILSVVVGLCPLLRHAVEHIGLMHKHEKCVFHSEFWWIVMIRPNDDRFSICICKAVSGTDHKKNVQNVAGNSPGRRSAIRMRKILQTESFGKHSSWHKMLRIGDENVYSTMPSIHKPRLAEHGLHRNTSVPVKCALNREPCAIYQPKWAELTWFISYTPKISNVTNFRIDNIDAAMWVSTVIILLVHYTHMK